MSKKKQSNIPENWEPLSENDRLAGEILTLCYYMLEKKDKKTNEEIVREFQKFIRIHSL